MAPRTRFRFGVVLVGAGILLILASVLHVLSAAEGDRPATTFARRRSYNQVKVAVHQALPIAGAYAAAGLLLVITGGRMAGRARLALTGHEGGSDPEGRSPQ